MDCQARGTKVRFIHYRETLYPVPSVMMGMRVVFSCSAQERIPSMANTMALLEATSLFSYKGSSQPLSTPYKQGSWSGRTPDVAWWRHVSWPHCHTVSIAGEDGTHGGLYLGNRQKRRRDLDNHRLPWGWETLVRRREKTDGTGEMRG